MSFLTIAVALVIVGFLVMLYMARQDAIRVPVENIPSDIDLRDTIITQVPPPVEIIEPAPAPEPTVTMAQFQTAYDIVRRHEGGYQDMPEDSGNYNSLRQNVGTNWGINAQVYEQHLGKPPTKQEMKDMPRHVALAIFKHLYWDRIDGDYIQNQEVANIYFDGHVNHGSWGVSMMQQAVGVTRDGVPGPQTLAAVNAADPYQLFTRYKAIRRQGYIDLAERRPKDQRFLRGWLLRIDSFFFRGPGGGSSNPQQVPNEPPASESSGSGGLFAGVAIAVTAYFLLS